MLLYDPEVKPDPQEWLALDEAERIVLCEEYHAAAGIRLPNLRLHAVTHAVVENQIALGIESVVRAEKRLQEDGLNPS